MNSNQPERGDGFAKIGDFRPQTADFCITRVAIDATLSKMSSWLESLGIVREGTKPNLPNPTDWVMLSEPS
ncbi:hypothetical protein ACTXT7_008376 [Hymenolepis weldensis]